MTAPTVTTSSRSHQRPRITRVRRRVVALIGLAWMRLRFRVLGVIAPVAAKRLAIALWCTIPKPRAARDHRTAPGSVRRLAVPRGGTVAVEVWGSGPVVYLVHGWGGWRAQLGAFVEPLVAAGYTVVAVDAPSHGDSDEGFMGHRRGTVVEMIEAMEATGQEFGPAAGMIAHSLGCTVAGQVMVAGLSVDRVVLIAPNHGFDDLLDEFARQLWLSDRVVAHLRGALEAITLRPLSTYDLDQLHLETALPPALVVHDRADRETPYRIGAQVAQAWPGARLLTTEGLGHKRILADGEVVRESVSHIIG